MKKNMNELERHADFPVIQLKERNVFEDCGKKNLKEEKKERNDDWMKEIKKENLQDKKMG